MLAKRLLFFRKTDTKTHEINCYSPCSHLFSIHSSIYSSEKQIPKLTKLTVTVPAFIYSAFILQSITSTSCLTTEQKFQSSKAIRPSQVLFNVSWQKYSNIPAVLKNYFRLRSPKYDHQTFPKSSFSGSMSLGSNILVKNQV